MTDRSLLTFAAGLLAVGAALPLTGRAQPAAALAHPAASDSLLVRFLPGTAPDAALQRVGAKGSVLALTLVPDLYRVSVDPADLPALLSKLAADPSVRYAEPNFIYFATGTQPVPPGVSLVSAPSAWAQTTGSGVRIAVLDTGLDFGHPDLPAPVASASFIPGETAQDGNRHGTHVSGTVLGLDNAFGVVGVAPTAELLTAKVLADSGSGTTDGIIQGMGWAVGNQARVINMSLGGGGFSQAFSDACDAAVAGGCLVIASAGNAGTSTPNYPASYAGAMSVSAVNFDLTIASFSSFGSTVAVTAPGVGILSSVPRQSQLGSTVTWGSTVRESSVLIGSGTGSFTAQTVWCGTGGVAGDFPASVSGNIAVIRRGGLDGGGATLTFRAKALNAQAAGAVAVIIANNTTGGPVASGTLQGGLPLPVVSVSQADGDALQAAPVTATVTVATTVNPNPYGSLSGTSMSAPHVSGVAGLLFAAYADRVPPPTPAQVRQALQESATDLGAPGRDDFFGHGLVNATAALARLGQILPPPVSQCGPADIANTAGTAGPDGLVNNGDFSLFFSEFFAGCPGAPPAGGQPQPCGPADIASTDGAAGPDGQLDNGDFQLFFSSFFGAACP